MGFTYNSQAHEYSIAGHDSSLQKIWSVQTDMPTLFQRGCPDVGSHMKPVHATEPGKGGSR